MRTRIFVVALTGMCMGVTSASAQTGQLGRSPNASQDPCPRGSRTITFDTNAGATSLEDLIQRSEVILVGAVVNVLPATRLNSERLDLIWLIETTSLISVNELLMGTLASRHENDLYISGGWASRALHAGRPKRSTR
jgi:hypothetical protein